MLQEQPQDLNNPLSVPDPVAPDGAADPDWFRPPSRRERWMAAGLFVGFGVFFVLLFFVTAGFWFRWVTLGLGLYSILHGLRYARAAVAADPGEGVKQRVQFAPPPLIANPNPKI